MNMLPIICRSAAVLGVCALLTGAFSGAAARADDAERQQVRLRHGLAASAIPDAAAHAAGMATSGEVEWRDGPHGRYAWLGRDGRLTLPAESVRASAGTVAFWLHVRDWDIHAEQPGRFLELAGDGVTLEFSRFYNAKEVGLILRSGTQRFAMGEWHSFQWQNDSWHHVTICWDAAGSGLAWPPGRLDLFLDGQHIRRMFADFGAAPQFTRVQFGDAVDMHCGIGAVTVLTRALDPAEVPGIYPLLSTADAGLEDALAASQRHIAGAPARRRADAWRQGRERGVIIEAEQFSRSSHETPPMITRFEGSQAKNWDHYPAATASRSECLLNWGDGQWVEWDVDVPQDGDYHLGLRLMRTRSVIEPVSRWEITIDGHPPLPELAQAAIPPTGGRVSLAGDALQFKDFAPAPGRAFRLTAGRHTLRIRKLLEFVEGLDQLVLSPVPLPNLEPIAYLDDYERPPALVVEAVERRAEGDRMHLTYRLALVGESPLTLRYTVSATTADPAVAATLRVDTAELALARDQRQPLTVSLTLPGTADGSCEVRIVLQQTDLPVRRVYKVHARVPQGEPRTRPVVSPTCPPEKRHAINLWLKDRKGPCPEPAVPGLLNRVAPFMELDLDAYIPALPVAAGRPAVHNSNTCSLERKQAAPDRGVATDAVTEVLCTCGATLSDAFSLAVFRGERLKQFIAPGSTYGGGEVLLSLGRLYEFTGDEAYARRAREVLTVLAKRFPRYAFSSAWGGLNRDLILGREDTLHQIMNTGSLGAAHWLEEAWYFRTQIVPAYDLVASSTVFTQADRDVIENNLLWAMEDDMLLASGGRHALGGNQPNEGVGYTYLGLTTGDQTVIRDVLAQLGHLDDLSREGVPFMKLMAWAYTGSFYDFVDLCQILKDAGIDLRGHEQLKAVLKVFPLMCFRDGQLPQMGVGGRSYRPITFYDVPKGYHLASVAHLTPRILNGLKLGLELWPDEFAPLLAYWEARRNGTYPADYALPSVHFEDIGISMLRGSGENPLEASCVYPRRGTGESQHNMLSFFLYGNGEILSYIPIADDWPGGRYASPYAWGYARGGNATVSKNFVNLDQRGTASVPCTLLRRDLRPGLSFAWARAAGYVDGVVGQRLLLMLDNVLVDFFHTKADRPRVMDWHFHAIGQMQLPADLALREAPALVQAELGRGGGYEFYRHIRRSPWSAPVLHAQWRLAEDNVLAVFSAAGRASEIIACRMPMFHDPKETITHEPTRFVHDPDFDGDHLVDVLLNRVTASEQVFSAVYDAYRTEPDVREVTVRQPQPDGGATACIEIIRRDATDIVAVDFADAGLDLGAVLGSACATDAALLILRTEPGGTRRAYVHEATHLRFGEKTTRFPAPFTGWLPIP